MAEGNKDGRSLKDMVADAVEEELSQHPKHTLTPQDLEAMVARKTQEKHRKVWKIAGAAAVFLIAAIGISIALNAQSLDAEADKPDQKEVVTEDGIVIEDEGWGSSPDDMLVIDDWAEIDVAKEYMSELLVPQYVPKIYKFKNLSIERIEEDYFTAIYIFNKKGTTRAQDTLIIEEYKQGANLSQNVVDSTARKYQCEKGQLFILDDGEDSKTATIVIDDGFVVLIQGTVADETLIDIMDGLI